MQFIYKIMEYNNTSSNETFTYREFPAFKTEKKCHDYISSNNIYSQVWVYDRKEWRAYMNDEIDDIEPVEIYDTEMIGETA